MLSPAVARQMILVGFLQAQNCTNLPASWRHPESRTDFLSPDFYADIARILEEGKFHLAFFDDRLAMPDRYGNDHTHAVEHGIRCVKLDPIVTMMVMGMCTSRLGLGATCSTTYYEPFHVARMFATVDLMTRGRAAWNVVTSLNDGEAFNMGRTEVMEHDLRYDRADEFMEVVLGHWDAWEDDALIVDKASGRFADGSRVHRLDHVGRFFRSRGPFTVPRSAQGHPVVIQAGASGRGRRFAARWGEVIFATAHDVPSGKRSYDSLKADAARVGRDPDRMKICTLVTPVCGQTKAEAEDKMALIRQLPLEIDALSLLAEAINFDVATKGLDEPFTTEELDSISGLQGIRDRVLAVSGKTNPTVRDFLRFSGRGTAEGAVVGGPREIADYLEERFAAGVCDGFVVGATHVPGAYAEFVRWVVPELQRRGIYHDDYTGPTLRENLGLPRPAVGDWRLPAAAGLDASAP
jgi:FMN-dependent oxidoreductase (nitrilotriacetate monooxygenase family)